IVNQCLNTPLQHYPITAMMPPTGRVPLTLFVFLFPHPAWADSQSSRSTSTPVWVYVIIAICDTSILSDRIYRCYERRVKKVAINNRGTIHVHLPPDLQVLPPLPVHYPAESLADNQSGLSSISYASRSDLEAFSTPSLARAVNSGSDGVSITMCVFVFCLIVHEVNIFFSDPF
ncbi:hypothetical protein K443DRAFT_92276, partial [Laccaria amethystina LaAM-08-1]